MTWRPIGLGNADGSYMSEAAVRLLVVTPSLSRQAGGLFTSVRRLAQNTADLGLEIRVYGLWDEDVEEDLQAWSPLRPSVYPSFGPLGYSPRFSARLATYVVSPSLIHLHGLWMFTSRACLSVSERFGVPRIISPRGMLDRWALGRSALKKHLARFLYEDANLRGAACVHALCEAELQQVRDFGLKRPVAVIPNGMDLPDPDPKVNIDPTPADWEGRRILLFMSRLHPKKGLIPLIQAWARMGENRDGWMLAIAGPDEVGHQDEIEQLIRELDLGESVRIVGPQYGERKDAWLRRADAFVLSSFSEGFPMAILEAMAYGLPVLMTPQCNFPEAEACSAAISVEPEVDALVDGLRRLMSLSDEELRTMGIKGRELVAQRYTWPHIARQMVDVYEWVLGERDRPECVHLG